MASYSNRSEGERACPGGGATRKAATYTARSYLLLLPAAGSHHALGKFMTDPLWVPVSGPRGHEDGYTCIMDWIMCKSRDTQWNPAQGG